MLISCVDSTIREKRKKQFHTNGPPKTTPVTHRQIHNVNMRRQSCYREIGNHTITINQQRYSVWKPCIHTHEHTLRRFYADSSPILLGSAKGGTLTSSRLNNRWWYWYKVQYCNSSYLLFYYYSNLFEVLLMIMFLYIYIHICLWVFL